MKKFSNMAEFAAHLGLSRSTVSYILNGKWRERNISPNTAERVLACAALHRFSPNFLGLAINGKISIDVAVLLSRGIYEHHRQAFFEFLDTVEANHLSYMIFQLAEGDANFAVLERLRNFRVSRALLLAPCALSDRASFEWWRNAAENTPDIEFLFYDYRFNLEPPGFEWPPNVFRAGFDVRKARAEIFDYVRRCGFRELHVFGGAIGPIHNSIESDVKILVHEFCPASGDLTEHGRTIGRTLAADPPVSGPRAVFISDDLATIGAIAEVLDRGFRVPEDFAFISWDGLKISRYFRKSVTTLEIPHREMLDFADAFAAGRQPERRLEVHARIRPGETMPLP